MLIFSVGLKSNSQIKCRRHTETINIFQTNINLVLEIKVIEIKVSS